MIQSFAVQNRQLQMSFWIGSGETSASLTPIYLYFFQSKLSQSIGTVTAL
jgi:hypothetical protein